jgi:N-acetylmuramoyl-L-alanine amidase
MFKSTSSETPKLHFTYIVALILSVLMFAAAIGYAVYWPRYNAEKETSTRDASIKAPSLEGHNLAAAKILLKKEGLFLKIDRRISSRIYAPNSIIAQNPISGSTLRKGDTIAVTVSAVKNNAAPENSKNEEAENVKTTDKPKFQPIPSIKPTINLREQVIVIDAGHQRSADLDKEPVAPGSSTMKAKTAGGTRGRNTGTPEYKVTLEIAKRLEAILEAKKMKVVMIRETNNVDIGNIQRAEIGNDAKAALVVRIHTDGSTDENKHGISTLYPANNEWTQGIFEKSRDAARIVQENVVKTSGHNDNGIVARDDLTGFNWSKVPTILVETGFLTNTQEEKDLVADEYQEKLAQGIADGIIQYLEKE